jgi:ribonuclease HI
VGRREESFVRALLDGLSWRDAAAGSGLAERDARRFLESIARFASTVPTGMQFGVDDASETGSFTELVIFTDGASLGNPGPAGAGGIISTRDGRLVDEFSESLGRATNNIAEYEAVRIGLTRAIDLGARRVILRLDSELVANQLTGRYRVKNPGLIDAYLRVTALLTRLDEVKVEAIPREENEEADRRAQMAARIGASESGRTGGARDGGS